MANFDALKRKGLGTPPALAEATSDVLNAPETAPSAPQEAKERVVTLPTTPALVREMDGRSARKTGRTVQFATRVSETFDKRFRKIAKRDGLMMVQLLEKALDAYEGKEKRE